MHKGNASQIRISPSPFPDPRCSKVTAINDRKPSQTQSAGVTSTPTHDRATFH
jgi:hypothetical protein